jgi:pteridine reductase
VTTSLTGKVALVTGAGRRVGRAIAEGLGRAGARVAIHYHSAAAGARELATALSAHDSAVAAVFEADLEDAAAAEALPREVARQMGRLDIVVNSASVMMRQPLGTVTPEAWDKVHHLNLRAYFFVSQGAADALRAARGKLVNISDLSAVEAWPGYLPHATSKAGVETLTRGLARALAPEVCVNAVAPGAVLLPEAWGREEEEAIVRTTPLRRLGSPADVVAAVLYLVTADYVTGTTLVVDGGRHLASRTH